MFDLQQFVRECRAALTDQNPTLEIEALVKSVLLDPTAIRDAFSGGKNVEQQGPVTFAYRDAALTVVDVTTPPRMRSPVHNHCMWAVIGIYDGQEHNRFFRYENGVLEGNGERLLKEGDVAVLEADAIHAISNPLATESSAIHVYGGDLVERPERSLWNPHTLDREDYEIDRLMTYISELSSSP